MVSKRKKITHAKAAFIYLIYPYTTSEWLYTKNIYYEYIYMLYKFERKKHCIIDVVALMY